MLSFSGAASSSALRPDHQRLLRDLVAQRFDWEGWERIIEQNGLTIDRPYRSRHPSFPDIVYPVDYGFVNGTMGADGQEVDVFTGSGQTGLAALLITTDFRKGDREVKLLHHCTPEQIYLVNGFINFDRTLMEGLLVMRRPMHELWEATPPASG